MRIPSWFNKIIRLSEFPKLFLLKRAIARAKADGKMSVLVELQTSNDFFYLKSVLERLHEQGHLVIIFLQEKLRRQVNELLATSFGRPALPVMNIRWIHKFPPTDFYLNATLSYDISVPKNSKRTISFSHTITSKTKYDVFSPAIEHLTDMFVPGDAFLTDVQTYCKDFSIKKIPEFHKVGCPKSDTLFDLHIDRKDVLAKAHLDPSLPTVFYAPTWNQDTSIFTWREEIFSLVDRYRINLIVKIHPGAYLDAKSTKSSGGVDWKAFFESAHMREKRIANVYLTDSPEYIMASDITMTDISTIWIEYYFLGKPMIFLETPKFFETHQKNSLGEFRDTYGYLVKDKEGLYAALDALLAHTAIPREPPDIREKLLYHPGRATEASIQEIERLFKESRT